MWRNASVSDVAAGIHRLMAGQLVLAFTVGQAIPNPKVYPQAQAGCAPQNCEQRDSQALPERLRKMTRDDCWWELAKVYST